jgi:inosine-uridine nucleoside N-ribohydrolase
MLKRLLRAIIILVLVVFAAYILVSNIAFFQGSGGAYRIKTIIDVDSGHGLDGMFAVARALTDKNIEVVGLISSHWNFVENTPDSTVKAGQEINEKILDLLNLKHIPNLRGANSMLQGNEQLVPVLSEGAQFIIENAQGLASGEKIRIITLGATTNLASAILLDSSIIEKLDCYISGLKYDPFRKAWNKNEFNTRNDLDAMDLILNIKSLEITVLPVTVSEKLIFQKSEMVKQMTNKANIWDYLLKYLETDSTGIQHLVMNDVALIEAIVHPKYATIREFYGPPENTRRKIRVYTNIKAESMIKDFWKDVEENTGY